MVLKDLIQCCRSFRRFNQEEPVSRETLLGLVDLARISASAANKQPLRYILSCDAQQNALIFPTLAWAAYLKDWPGPAEGERPAAYIIMLADKAIASSCGCDQGIAAQSILLGATEQGLGGCIIASVRKDELRQALAIPAEYEILLVIALGKPKETVVLEELPQGGDIRYWRDAQSVHHVPKRSLAEIIIGAVGENECR